MLSNAIENRSRNVCVLTGAGISADSGLATFRDANGLWEGHRVEDVATPEAWIRSPEIVWKFYQARRAQLAQVQPNAAHYALFVLERYLEAGPGSFTLITQNVDDLHQRSGSTVLAMHGQLTQFQCERCHHRIEDRSHFNPNEFRPCENCQFHRMRPDIVWFGEMPYYLDEIEAAMQRCTDFVAIGTSGLVYPAAGLLTQARFRGARTWVITLDPPVNLDSRDQYMRGRAAEAVPRWLDQEFPGLL